jgi:hypothetical protein
LRNDRISFWCVQHSVSPWVRNEANGTTTVETGVRNSSAGNVKHIAAGARNSNRILKMCDAANAGHVAARDDRERQLTSNN